jgi:hypothetical protein
VCFVEWIPGGVEQEHDFAAQCRKLTADLYIGFARDETAGRVACLFKPAIELNQNDVLAELSAAVGSWTESCMEKERTQDENTTSCWLRAVEAINPFAADADGPLVNEVTELQRAWLSRARDLLTARAQVVESIQLTSSNGCVADPSFDGMRCRQEPPALLEKVVTPAVKVAIAKKGSATVQLPSVVKAKKAERRKNFSRAHAVAVSRAKTQSVKLAVPILKRKKLKVAAKAQSSTRAAAKSGKPTSRNHALLTKTATTSKCFVSPSWC